MSTVLVSSMCFCSLQNSFVYNTTEERQRPNLVSLHQLNISSLGLTYICRMDTSISHFGQVPITKTRLIKYIENFTTKNLKFSDKNLIFFIFLL